HATQSSTAPLYCLRAPVAQQDRAAVSFVKEGPGPETGRGEPGELGEAHTRIRGRVIPSQVAGGARQAASSFRSMPKGVGLLAQAPACGTLQMTLPQPAEGVETSG